MVSAACLVWSFIASSSNSQELIPGQIYNTPNLVQPTIAGTDTSSWVNGVYQSSLTCFAWGNPGYCGPNPITTPGYNINFSYGTTDIYQIANVASVLPNSGTGLRVDGYNFSFMAKNGNGWDNGQVDYLYAYVHLTDKNNGVVYYKSYDLNYKFDWTTFNYSENFKTPYASKDLNNVTYGFVGRDNNFWAGPYGPEVTNISFSLKYSVDPCFVNVLSSPSCPGYLDAISKLTPSSTNTVSYELTTPTVTANEPLQPTTSISSPTVISNNTTITTATPSTNNPQPKIGEVSVSSSQNKTTLSTSQILSIVRNEQSRINSLETTTAQQAMTQAQQQAEMSVSESLNVSANTMSKSNTASQTITEQTRTNSIYSLSANTATTTQSNATSIYSINSNTYQLGINDVQKNSLEETQKSEGLRFTGTDLISNVINSALPVTGETRETKSSAVNQQAQDNELSGGISISSIARQPIGFENYFVNLKDVAFYEPKEIYRNQRTIDNARAQRFLNGASDRLHQEMVDSQYKR